MRARPALVLLVTAGACFRSGAILLMERVERLL
jgi:hypothetical protein